MSFPQSFSQWRRGGKKKGERKGSAKQKRGELRRVRNAHEFAEHLGRKRKKKEIWDKETACAAFFSLKVTNRREGEEGKKKTARGGRPR